MVSSDITSYYVPLKERDYVLGERSTRFVCTVAEFSPVGILPVSDRRRRNVNARLFFFLYKMAAGGAAAFERRESALPAPRF